MVSTRLLDSLLEPVHVSESDRRNPLGLSFSVAPAFCLQIPLRLNKPTETQYFYTDGDTTGASLDGKNTYEITFGPGQEPPVNGFWSLTLYNAQHFFHPNDLKRYSLGTKNKTLKRNADGSLTLYAGTKSPNKDKESNWLPAPDGHFSLYIRSYWGKQPILDGSWQPPKIVKAN